MGTPKELTLVFLDEMEKLGLFKDVKVKCNKCNWNGYSVQLACVDKETTRTCPDCGSTGWVFD